MSKRIGVRKGKGREARNDIYSKRKEEAGMRGRKDVKVAVRSCIADDRLMWYSAVRYRLCEEARIMGIAAGVWWKQQG